MNVDSGLAEHCPEGFYVFDSNEPGQIDISYRHGMTLTAVADEKTFDRTAHACRHMVIDRSWGSPAKGGTVFRVLCGCGRTATRAVGGQGWGASYLCEECYQEAQKEAGEEAKDVLSSFLAQGVKAS